VKRRPRHARFYRALCFAVFSGTCRKIAVVQLTLPTLLKVLRVVILAP
jgi:hypothetical protein